MKKRILVFIDWFYPSFKAGGPIKSVYNLVENLKGNYHFFIVTSDRDIDGSLVTQTEEDLETDVWIKKEGYEVIYLSPEKQTAEFYKELAEKKKIDWAYYNSMFSRNFTLLPYRALRTSDLQQMIAPRGMLGKGALSIKPFKKKIFLLLAKRLIFERSTYWHATSEQEASEIKKELGAASKQIRIASNLASALAAAPQKIIKEKGSLKLFFLSRISQKKNLLYLLERIADLKELINLSLNIYGPIENDKHWEKCKTLIESDERIAFHGEIHPNHIPAMIGEHHLLALPTLHENYGHVIAECFSQARPVLISNRTPWLDLASKKIGKEIPLESIELWLEAIQSFYEMTQDEYNVFNENCWSFAKEKLVSQEEVQKSQELFVDA